MSDFRTEHKNDFAMTWVEIAKALGYHHPASVRWVYEKAMRKLRWRYTKEDIREILNGQSKQG